MPKPIKNNDFLKSVITIPASASVSSEPPVELVEILNYDVDNFGNNLDKVKKVLETLSSMESQSVCQIIKNCLLCANMNNYTLCSELIIQVANHHYDEAETITLLKREKNIDVILALALLHKYYFEKINGDKKSIDKIFELKRIAKVINLLTISYPVEFMMHGGKYAEKWRQIFQENVEISNLERRVGDLANTTQFEKTVYGYHPHKFLDIAIPL